MHAGCTRVHGPACRAPCACVAECMGAHAGRRVHAWPCPLGEHILVLCSAVQAGHKGAPAGEPAARWPHLQQAKVTTTHMPPLPHAFTPQDILLPASISWGVMWAAGLLLAAGVAHKEALRLRLAAQGAVWTRIASVAGRREGTALAQTAVDAMSDQQVAALAAQQMEVGAWCTGGGRVRVPGL